MNKLLATLLVFLLSTSVQSGIIGLPPYCLPAPLPIERYYEFPNFVSLLDNVWHNFGTLNQSIILNNDQYVDISYGVNADANSGSGHFVTRLLVDGHERKEFRSIDGNTRYIHTAAFNRIALCAGAHWITLQYRTPCNITSETPSDWRVGYLKLTY